MLIFANACISKVVGFILAPVCFKGSQSNCQSVRTAFHGRNSVPLKQNLAFIEQQQYVPP